MPPAGILVTEACRVGFWIWSWAESSADLSRPQGLVLGLVLGLALGPGLQRVPGPFSFARYATPMLLPRSRPLSRERPEPRSRVVSPNCAPELYLHGNVSSTPRGPASRRVLVLAPALGAGRPRVRWIRLWPLLDELRTRHLLVVSFKPFSGHALTTWLPRLRHTLAWAKDRPGTQPSVPFCTLNPRSPAGGTSLGLSGIGLESPRALS